MAQYAWKKDTSCDQLFSHDLDLVVGRGNALKVQKSYSLKDAHFEFRIPSFGFFGTPRGLLELVTHVTPCLCLYQFGKDSSQVQPPLLRVCWSGEEGFKRRNFRFKKKQPEEKTFFDSPCISNTTMGKSLAPRDIAQTYLVKEERYRKTTMVLMGIHIRYSSSCAMLPPCVYWEPICS